MREKNNEIQLYPNSKFKNSTYLFRFMYGFSVMGDGLLVVGGLIDTEGCCQGTIPWGMTTPEEGRLTMIDNESRIDYPRRVQKSCWLHSHSFPLQTSDAAIGDSAARWECRLTANTTNLHYSAKADGYDLETNLIMQNGDMQTLLSPHNFGLMANSIELH